MLYQNLREALSNVQSSLIMYVLFLCFKCIALFWNKLAIKLAIISYYIQLPQSLNA